MRRQGLKNATQQSHQVEHCPPGYILMATGKGETDDGTVLYGTVRYCTVWYGTERHRLEPNKPGSGS